MPHDRPLSRRVKSRLLLALLAVAVASVLSLLLVSLRERRSSDAPSRPAAAHLPPDVEGVMTSFSFSETDREKSVKISGKRVVRRGRALLGLRSNVVKTNFIDDLTATVRSGKGSTTFSAAQAEWDGTSSRPLLLKKGVEIAVNGRNLGTVRQARVYLKSGVIETGDGASYRMY